MWARRGCDASRWHAAGSLPSTPISLSAAAARLLPPVPPSLGLPDYSGLGGMGTIGSGAAFGSVPSLAAAAAMGRGASMSPPLPPLDPAAALTSQVSLASFGLGGLGNGMGFGGLGAGLPPPIGNVGSGAGLLHPLTPSVASASSSTTQLSRTRLFVVVHKVRGGRCCCTCMLGASTPWKYWPDCTSPQPPSLCSQSIGDEALGRMFRAFPGMVSVLGRVCTELACALVKTNPGCDATRRAQCWSRAQTMRRHPWGHGLASPCRSSPRAPL